MLPRSGRARRCGRGQTLVEFALILPAFLLTTLGVLDGARVYMAQISLTNAVREAAMFASTGNYNAWCRDPGDESQADPSMPVPVACPAGASAANYAGDPGNLAYRVAIESSGLDFSRITLFAPTCGTGAGAPASSCPAVPSPTLVQIHAAYRFDVLTPGLSQIWGSSVTLDATSTARVIQ
jgi:Flp pilus assembly protein TadG